MARVQGRDTKRSIIEATYDVLRVQSGDNVSLSKIARVIDVTKTAIFRHFSNKETLFKAVEADFFDHFSPYLLPIKEGFDAKNRAMLAKGFDDFITFLLTPPSHYLYYLLKIAVPKNDSEYFCHKMLLARGIELGAVFAFAQRAKDGSVHIVDKPLFFRHSYIVVSIISFLELYIEERDMFNSKVCPPKEYGEHIRQLLSCGFTELKPISDERIEVLQQAVLFPKENTIYDKAFEAMSHVLEVKGFNSMTLDSIAKELSMTKSALYNYFRNKEDMIRQLLTHEITAMSDTIKANAQSARDKTELIAVYLYTLLGYILNKPYCIPILKWLRFNDRMLSVMRDGDFDHDSTAFLKLDMPDIGINLNDMAFTRWLVTLPITLGMQGVAYGLSREDMLRCIKQFIGYIRCGIDIFDTVKTDKKEDYVESK